MKPRKTLEKILFGSKNIRFDDLNCIGAGFRIPVVAHQRQSPYLHASAHSRTRQSAGRARAGQAISGSTIHETGGTIQPAIGRRRMKDYHINIFYSEEDRGDIADIPDLEACSAYGKTPDKALAEVQVARRAWIKAAKAASRPVPPPRYRPAIYQVPAAG